MKNTKIAKLITLSLALAVIIAAAVGLSVSAETPEAPSVEITVRNVSYDSELIVLFAVDDTKAGEGAEVELFYYLGDPTVDPAAKAYAARTYEKGYTDNSGVTYPAFYTAGFPLARIGETVYANAHIVGTDIYSPVVRYSVAEYLNKRLYVDETTELQDKFYSSLLDSAGYLQTILNTDTNENNNVENTLANTAYVFIEGNATLDGNYGSGMYALGSTVTPDSIDGSVTLWSVEETVGEETTVRTINNGEAITVAGRTLITPAKAEAGSYYEVLGGNDFTNAKGYASGGSGLQIMDDLVYYNTSKGSIGVSSTGNCSSLTDDNGNKYLTFKKTNNVNSTDIYFKKQNDTVGNCFVFEAKIKLSETVVSANKTGITLFLAESYNNTNNTPVLNAGVSITAIAADGAFSHYSLVDGTRVEAEKWYTLTMEYYTDSNVVRYYIDGVCFATIKDFTPASEINYVGAFITKWDVGTVSICFDDMVCKAINKTYVSESAE